MEKYDKVTDEQLIRDFRNGDREIMDHLMMKYKAMVSIRGVLLSSPS